MEIGDSIYIHIGFSKAASTWLQSYFKRQKDLDYIEKSYFFSPLNNEYEMINKEIQSYRSLFKGGKGLIKLESDEHIILPDIHPVLNARGTRLKSVDTIISRIKNHIPHVKIILVVRNQYDLLISRYSQYIVGGGKFPFYRFAQEMLCCSQDEINYYENDYYMIYNKLTKSFDKNNVHVILQEHLKIQEDKIIKELDNFIGCKGELFQSKNIINQRKGLSNLGLNLLRRINNVLVIEKSVTSHVPKTYLPPFLYRNLIIRGIRFIDYFFLKHFSRTKKNLFTNDIKSKLDELFKENNHKLSKQFDINLNKLGY